MVAKDDAVAEFIRDRFRKLQGITLIGHIEALTANRWTFSQRFV